MTRGFSSDSAVLCAALLSCGLCAGCRTLAPTVPAPLPAAPAAVPAPAPAVEADAGARSLREACERFHEPPPASIDEATFTAMVACRSASRDAGKPSAFLIEWERRADDEAALLRRAAEGRDALAGIASSDPAQLFRVALERRSLPVLRALAQSPGPGALPLVSAAVALAEGQPRRARAVASARLVEHPQESDARLVAAEALLAEGRVQAALVVAGSEPRLRARVLARAGDLRSAREALAADSADESRAELAWLLALLREWDAAARLAGEVRRVRPGHPVARLAADAVQLARGDPRAAFADLADLAAGEGWPSERAVYYAALAATYSGQAEKANALFARLTASGSVPADHPARWLAPPAPAMQAAQGAAP